MNLDDIVGTNENICLDDKFSDGRPLTELVDLLLLGEVDPLKDDFLMLECSRVEGSLRTADNKRLACLREWARRIHRPVDVRVEVTETYGEKHYVSAFLQHYTTESGNLPRVRDGRPHYHQEDEDRVLDRRRPIGAIGQSGNDRERGKGYRGKGKRDRDEGLHDRGFRGSKGKGKSKSKMPIGKSKGLPRDNGREDKAYGGEDGYDKDSRAGDAQTFDDPKLSTAEVGENEGTN